MKRASAANLKTEQIMTVAALARYLRCHRSLVYRLLKNKQIPAFKIGSDWRFSRSTIDAWIASLYKTTNPPVTPGRKSKAN